MKKNFILFFLIFHSCFASAKSRKDTLPIREVKLPNGMNIHYLSAGSGDALMFVHGSISDYTYWNAEMKYFSKYYHVISYSRRYNYPNHNPKVNGYSAVADAEDLYELIETLHLGKVYVIGHSYGALTSLYLTIHHPDLVKKIILAEPPAVPLLDHLNSSSSELGKELKQNIDKKMVAPMQKYFKAGQSEKGVEVFINYVFNDTIGWKKMSVDSKAETMRDINEWNVMMPKGTLFPAITKKEIASIKIPVLLLSGDKSYKFLNLIDAELHIIIPNNRQIIFKGVGHQMWLQKSHECEKLSLDFLKGRVLTQQQAFTILYN